jgi:hypothetical protein
MGQPDLAARLLAEKHLPDLLRALLRDHRVEILRVERSELKLIERLTDIAVRARLDGREVILHAELQARHYEDVPARVLLYQALLHHRHRLPVVSVVVYLTPDPPTRPVPRGLRFSAGDRSALDLRYLVFCPWQEAIDVAEVQRYPALAPLAALTPGIAAADLPALQTAIEGAALPAAERGDLLAITYLLAGRRFPADLLTSMLRSRTMEDSSTFQYVTSVAREQGLSEGREQGLSEGREQGREQGLAEAIVALVAARLGSAPRDLETQLCALDRDALRGLLRSLAAATDRAELEALIPR